MEIGGRREWLPDDTGANELTVLVYQLTVRFVLEEYLREARDGIRINHAEDDGGDDGVEDGGDEIAAHSDPLSEMNGSDDYIDELNAQKWRQDAADSVDKQVAAQK